MKRIQRDKDEQLIHRKTDSKILIQRNKNILIDIIERQQVENKNTMNFLSYVLSKRAPIIDYKYKEDLNETDIFL